VPALPGTSQMKGTRLRGQIRSESPDTTGQFYGPQLEAVSDARVETIWRVLDVDAGMGYLT
jgi:hypothetical protein